MVRSKGWLRLCIDFRKRDFTLSLTNKCIFSDKVRLPVRNEMGGVVLTFLQKSGIIYKDSNRNCILLCWHSNMLESIIKFDLREA